METLPNNELPKAKDLSFDPAVGVPREGIPPLAPDNGSGPNIVFGSKSVVEPEHRIVDASGPGTNLGEPDELFDGSWRSPPSDN